MCGVARIWLFVIVEVESSRACCFRAAVAFGLVADNVYFPYYGDYFVLVPVIRPSIHGWVVFHVGQSVRRFGANQQCQGATHPLSLGAVFSLV